MLQIRLDIAVADHQRDVSHGLHSIYPGCVWNSVSAPARLALLTLMWCLHVPTRRVHLSAMSTHQDLLSQRCLRERDNYAVALMPFRLGAPHVKRPLNEIATIIIPNLSLTMNFNLQAVRCILLMQHSQNIDRFVLLFSAVISSLCILADPNFRSDGTIVSTKTVYKACNSRGRQYRSEAPRIPEAFVIRKLFSFRTAFCEFVEHA